jgi:hypothetical protein
MLPPLIGKNKRFFVKKPMRGYFERSLLKICVDFNSYMGGVELNYE